MTEDLRRWIEQEFVRKDFFEATIKPMREDVAEIKSDAKTSRNLIKGVLVTALLSLVVMVVGGIVLASFVGGR